MLAALPLGDSKHGTAISTTGPEPAGSWSWATVIELPQIVTRVPTAAAFAENAPLASETRKPSPIRGPILKSIEDLLPNYAAFLTPRLPVAPRCSGTSRPLPDSFLCPLPSPRNQKSQHKTIDSFISPRGLPMSVDRRMSVEWLRDSRGHA